jgi:group I intron endonuclease
MAKEAVYGIYEIRNSVNGKVYIGQSQRGAGVHGRWRNHRTQLRGGNHHNRKLQSAWAKYGAESFVFSVLLEVPQGTPSGTIDDHEIRYIRANEAVTNGYNILPGGKNCSVNTFVHRKTLNSVEKTKSMISMANKQKWQNPEYRELMSTRRREMWMDEKYRADNLSIVRQTWENEPATIVRRKKMSESAKLKWADPEFREKQQAASARPEIKAKRSESKKRIWADPERRPALVAAVIEGSRKRRGQKRSPEQLITLRAAHARRSASPEYRAKLRAAWDVRRARVLAESGALSTS